VRCEGAKKQKGEEEGSGNGWPARQSSESHLYHSTKNKKQPRQGLSGGFRDLLQSIREMMKGNEGDISLFYIILLPKTCRNSLKR
jgi:hypothetical protein